MRGEAMSTKTATETPTKEKKVRKTKKTAVEKTAAKERRRSALRVLAEKCKENFRGIRDTK